MIPLIVQNIGVFDARVLRVLRVFRAIRALRALRVIRTIRSWSPLLMINYNYGFPPITIVFMSRFLKNLQIIVTTVLQSIPAMGSIVILISLVLCILQLLNSFVHACTVLVISFFVLNMSFYRYFCHHRSWSVWQCWSWTIWKPSKGVFHSISTHHSWWLVLHVLWRPRQLP